MTSDLSICPQCGAQFECGAKAGKSTCWCMDLPRIMPVPVDGEAACLCPDCLHRAIETQAMGGPAS